MTKLTPTQLMQLQRSYYPTRDEARDQFCLLCSAQIHSGELTRHYATGYVHTSCLIPDQPIRLLWASLHLGVAR